jgi:hypothetical protein
MRALICGDRSAGEIAHAHGLEDPRPELRAARHES